MAFLVCLLFRESIGVAITESLVIFVRKFFVSSNNDTATQEQSTRWIKGVSLL